MYQTVSFEDFVDAFESHGKEEQFSFEGLQELYEYIVGYEDKTGEQIELDVIALCCEYTEFKNLDEIKEDYADIDTIEDLRDQTTVIEFDDGIIIEDF